MQAGEGFQVVNLTTFLARVAGDVQLTVIYYLLQHCLKIPPSVLLGTAVSCSSCLLQYISPCAVGSLQFPSAEAATKEHVVKLQSLLSCPVQCLVLYLILVLVLVPLPKMQ